MSIHQQEEFDKILVMIKKYDASLVEPFELMYEIQKQCNGDDVAIVRWWNTEQPELEGQKPREVMMAKHGDRLVKLYKMLGGRMSP